MTAPSNFHFMPQKETASYKNNLCPISLMNKKATKRQIETVNY